MSSEPSPELPLGLADDRALLLAWLDYLRGGVIRNLERLTDDEARWRPDDSLTSLLGIVNHLINETARHAGHADATRELLDGTTGG